MAIETRPIIPATGVSLVSDVSQIRFNGAELVILVATESAGNGRFRGLEIKFPHSRAFRVIDELDLNRYVRSDGFHAGHYVLAVEAGGWASEESELQGMESKHEGAEWLIVTGNLCVSVFSRDDPVVIEGEFDDAP